MDFCVPQSNFITAFIFVCESKSYKFPTVTDTRHSVHLAFSRLHSTMNLTQLEEMIAASGNIKHEGKGYDGFPYGGYAMFLDCFQRSMFAGSVSSAAR
jgi:hypothetical protein